MTDLEEKRDDLGDDLEDGEIESDGEEVREEEKVVVEKPAPPIPAPKATNDGPAPKRGPEPGSRSHSKGGGRGGGGSGGKGFVGDDQDDWAVNVEKALAQALGKEAPASIGSNSSNNHNSGAGDKESKSHHHHDQKQRSRDGNNDDRHGRDRKQRKRPNRENKDRNVDRKKRSRYNEDDPVKPKGDEDMDEYEMLNVRGGSPPPGGVAPPGKGREGEKSGNESEGSYSSYESYDSVDYRRQQRRNRNNNNSRNDRSNRRSHNNNSKGSNYDKRNRTRDRDHHDRGSNSNNNANNNSNANDSDNSERNQPRKMELCKFYLMECCAKREKCLYMHSDFPCKYYYLGQPCQQKEACKFSHGKPLSEALKNILLKHLETAPKEILGDFPRMGRENANKLINIQHKKLCQEFNVPDETEKPTDIPSLLEIVTKPPPNMGKRKSSHEKEDQKSKNEKRKSRWCDTKDGGSGSSSSNMPKFQKNIPPPAIPSEKAKNIMSLRNLTNVLTQEQIENLAAMGVETLDQVKHLTVMQLTELGLSISQLSEIQMNAMQMEKLITGQVDTLIPATKPKEEESKPTDLPNPPPTQPPVVDTDMRMAPKLSQDVDMRFLGPPPNLTVPPPLITEKAPPILKEIASPDAQEDRLEPTAVIDYSQYLKEANINIDSSKNEEPTAEDEPKLLIDDRWGGNEDEDDDDEEEESALRIADVDEEKEQSDNEETQENGTTDEREKVQDEAKKEDEQTTASSVSYWPMNLPNLGPLSKIDVSSSVSKIFNQSEPMIEEKEEPKKEESFSASLYGSVEANQDPRKEAVETYNPNAEDVTSSPAPPDPRMDPRMRDPRDPRYSRDQIKSPTPQQPPASNRPSIYDMDESELHEEPTALKPDQDMRVNSFFMDSSELANRDVDLRLPFKPMLQNYVPASEIDGSITSHLPMIYKVVECDIPKPSYKEIKRRMPVPEATQDPRLRRIFGLVNEAATPVAVELAEPSEVDPIVEKYGTPEKSSDPRMDPRRRKEAISAGASSNTPSSSGVDIQIVLQKSPWYKDLGSKNKILVNQQLSLLTGELKKFREDTSTPNKMFDMAFVSQQNPTLANILQQLGVYVDEEGELQLIPASQLSPGGLGGPQPNLNDPNLGIQLPDLASLLQQQQQQGVANPGLVNILASLNPTLLAQQRNPAAFIQSMGQQSLRPGLLGIAPIGFPPPGMAAPFDEFGQQQPGEMNFMNFNENNPPGMGGNFFGQMPPRMNNNSNNNSNNSSNNRGNYRNNNRNERWSNQRDNRGGDRGRNNNQQNRRNYDNRGGSGNSRRDKTKI